MECSAKNDSNVKETFIEAAKLLYKKSYFNSTDKIKKEEKNCCSRCFD